VNASLWDYAHTARLAVEEDLYFGGHPLFKADAQALLARFVEPGRLIDLGCGTGRIALRFAREKFSVLAVDLSRAMLRRVGEKADADGLQLGRMQANLCDLRCLPDGSFRYATSMFSTLGMIRGPVARRRALAEASRILEQGGRLALHAHNIWLNFNSAEGRRWLLGQTWRAVWRDPAAGDRRMTYRGVPGMEVHLYRWGELKRALRRAGFKIDEVLPIKRVDSQPISAPWFWHGLRAGGWLVFARKK
jgi:SAM-dependent methyltransferase